MADRTEQFLWLLASAVTFAAMGAIFGAVTGVATREDGRNAGTALGWGVARAFARAARRELSPTATGLLVGGVDGASFLAAVGLLLGLFISWEPGQEWARYRTLVTGAVLLFSAATSFGLFGIGLARTGPRVLLGLCVGGVGGVLVGYWAKEADGALLGCLSGLALGSMLAAAWRT